MKCIRILVIGLKSVNRKQKHNPQDLWRKMRKQLINSQILQISTCIKYFANHKRQNSNQT